MLTGDLRIAADGRRRATLTRRNLAQGVSQTKRFIKNGHKNFLM